MKTKRFLLPLLLAVVIVGVSALAGFVLANGSEEKPQEPQRVQTESCIEDEPIEALIEENAEPMPFQWERSSAAMELLESGPLKTRGNEWPYEWPDYYGGAYFDEDNDIVYIYLTDMSKKPVLEKTLDEYKDCVVFLECRLNLNELLALAQSTGDLLRNAGFEVCYTATDEINHKASVAVYHEDYETAVAYLQSAKIANREFLDLISLSERPQLLNNIAEPHIA